MKKLTTSQQTAVDRCVNSIAEYRCALNSSKTGTGKTVMAVHTALRLKCPVIVIAPKSVLPHWRRELHDHGIQPLAVVNYEKARRGIRGFLTAGAKTMRWTVPEGTLIIWDEVQRCKSPYTLNTRMLIAASMQRIDCLLLSATAAENCTEMRGIGYALGLHSLNASSPPLRSWHKWMQAHGCWQDGWNGWHSGPREKLAEIHNVLYKDRAIRLTEADMPDAFRHNHVMVEEIEFSQESAIRGYYREAGVTPDFVKRLVEDGTIGEDANNALTKLLRARQLAEMAKIPEITDMARDLVDEGFSVVVFLNFRESALAARDAIARELEGLVEGGVSIIIGDQTETERTAELEHFRDDRRRVCVCTSAAGGVGIDGLQDTHGVYQRVSLISPSFSAQEFRQTLGRLPRAYSKSGVLQKILVASGTVEEYVITSLRRKLANMDTLHGT